MIEYIKNIIPRIQHYSKKLDQVENFVDKNWIFVDERGQQEEYLFEREGNLIMTNNHNTKVGKWRLLATGQLLIDRTNNDYVKLEKMFVEQALLVLKQSATNDTPFILINQQLIPDLDAVKYLENYEYQKSTINIPVSEQKYRLLNTGEIIAPETYEGKEININNEINFFGIYKVANDNTGKHILIIDNVIRRVFYRVKFWYNNQYFFIEQKNYNELQIGDKVFEEDHSKIPINKLIEVTGKYQIKYSIMFDEDYKIIKLIDKELDQWKTIMIIILLLIFFGLIIQLSKS